MKLRFLLLMILLSLPAIAAIETGESYHGFSNDGAWCWFSDPRAVYYKGQTEAIYAGWVNSRGDIVVGVYDCKTGCVDTALVQENLQVDDHANPSLLIRVDGRIMVFYSKHSAKDGPLTLRVSTYPENIHHWQPATQPNLNDNPAYPPEMRRDYCYTNPIQLSNEKNKIYLFWRGIDFKPCLSTSRDGGRTWEKGRILIQPEASYANRRPYLKVDSNNKDQIHFAFTDGHPRNETTNSIYYACYRDGAFYKANGEKIAGLDALPLKPDQCDLVYDGAKSRAWIWDVASDAKGFPVMVYTRLPQEKEHLYHYARWDGKTWRDYRLTAAGAWFPQTPVDKSEPEPHYSGGIVLDHADPSVVYLSRPIKGVFEIEKWQTKDSGKSWKKELVTKDSKNNNVRPFVVRNHPADGPQVLWMNINKYVHYTDYQTAIKMNSRFNPLTTELTPDAVTTAMTRVANWQLAHPGKHSNTDWTQGALYGGMTAWALMADESTYLDSVKAVSERNNWKLGRRKYHADDHRIGWSYLQLYKKYADPAMLEQVKKSMDWLLANQSPASLEFGTPNCQDRWAWCDALFMSPPVLTDLSVLTNDRKYLDFMNKEFWATTDYLYDKEEHLYYRDSRYFPQREKNGAKIFWSRGNGWVIGGLAQILEVLPKEYPDYDRYVQLYQEMAAKISAIQPADGLWRPSLLDPDSYPQPESSGSGFYCYALAWGINNGLLDKTAYLPVVAKSWAGLVKAVHPNGKLGYVQPIGADPRHVNSDLTEVYGVGAFLLAGTEVYKLALFGDTPRTTIEVRNPQGAFRPQETVSLDGPQLAALFPNQKLSDLAVFSDLENRFLVTQTLTGPDGKPEQLLFQSDWSPYASRTFQITPKTANLDLPQAFSRTHGMYVKERMDDFAWESDRIAFRMYGKALEVETISSGVDVWVKSVRYPILEKWFKANDYHADHGEGLDFYKVGPTRGCGGLAIWKNGKMYGSRNYRNWKILANGPIRTVFELEYEPWDVDGVAFSEVKRISIDLGANLSRFESRFQTSEKQMDLAVGIVKVKTSGEMTYNLQNGWLTYWHPEDPANGIIGCGVVLTGKENLRFVDSGDHGLLISQADAKTSFVYYTGAGWSKSGDFPDRESWSKYVEDFAGRIQNPLKITFKK